MSDTVIKVENLSKVYRVGEWGTGTISHDLNRWWKTKILRQEDPYSKIGQTNDRTQKAQKDEFVWALKDINFEVKQGEVLGIIGKNGAGKSTLLKVLSRITAPTTGQALIKGRVASLLEVGTGFHPEMTGRENIYLNGTINGMTRPEITRKLDEIVDFAGVAKYLDTPVKRYSSGMKVRLGFAVAAFLEPEILIVDEVLAVGDAEFQKKAIGKMQDVSKGEGRTVLFVSHNMGSIRQLCKKSMLLINGKIDELEETEAVIKKYLSEDSGLNGTWMNNNITGDIIELKAIEILDYNKQQRNEFFNDELIIIRLNLVNYQIEEDTQIGIEVINSAGITVFTNYTTDNNFILPSEKGDIQLNIKIPPFLLNEGIYLISIKASKHKVKWIFNYEKIVKLTCHYNKNNVKYAPQKREGVVYQKIEWTL